MRENKNSWPHWGQSLAFLPRQPAISPISRHFTGFTQRFHIDVPLRQPGQLSWIADYRHTRHYAITDSHNSFRIFTSTPLLSFQPQASTPTLFSLSHYAAFAISCISHISCHYHFHTTPITLFITLIRHWHFIAAALRRHYHIYSFWWGQQGISFQ